MEHTIDSKVDGGCKRPLLFYFFPELVRDIIKRTFSSASTRGAKGFSCPKWSKLLAPVPRLEPLEGGRRAKGFMLPASFVVRFQAIKRGIYML